MSKLKESQIIEALSNSRKSKYSKLRENYVGEDPLVGQVDQINPVDPGEAIYEPAIELEFDPDYEEESEDDNENETAGEDDMFDDNKEYPDYDVTEDFDLEDLTDEELQELIIDAQDELADRASDVEECDPVEEDEFVDDEVEVVDDENELECDPVEEDEIVEKTVRKRLSSGRRRQMAKTLNKNRRKGKAKAKRNRRKTMNKKGDSNATYRNGKKVKGSELRRMNKKKSGYITRFESDEVYANEEAFLTLINGVISDYINESENEFAPFEVVAVNDGYVKGNKIYFECTARYADGEEANATFVLTGRPDGYYSVAESNDVFDAENIQISGTYHMKGNRFVFDTMGYRMDNGDEIVTESFKVVNEK